MEDIKKLKEIRDKKFEEYLKADEAYKKADLGNIAPTYMNKFIYQSEYNTYMHITDIKKSGTYITFYGPQLSINEEDVFCERNGQMDEYEITDFDLKTGLCNKKDLEIISSDIYYDSYKKAIQKIADIIDFNI